MTKALAIDLDQTLCELKKPHESYLDVLPLPGAVETMQFLKAKGYELIIFTARGQVSCNGNIGLINKERLPDMITWLNKWNIPFDSIVVGKPHVMFFIDDKNIEFKSWEGVKNRILEEENKQQEIS